jgi:hypothetical protein
VHSHDLKRAYSDMAHVGPMHAHWHGPYHCACSSPVRRHAKGVPGVALRVSFYEVLWLQ